MYEEEFKSAQTVALIRGRSLCLKDFTIALNANTLQQEIEQRQKYFFSEDWYQ